ncbi:hypothetical protein B0H17DRAFT_1141553 [Mycena rosella]|uniref:Uncharacterized protein n=1 Tax=Mycena rosella TaxID=1033263 RepID=A0AAD7G8Y0_MYCRO|nr:hypothetical protein B0H17DRAFT_1141553 [Mycena rosella]
MINKIGAVAGPLYGSLHPGVILTTPSVTKQNEFEAYNKTTASPKARHGQGLQPDPLLWGQMLPGREQVCNLLGFVHVVMSPADMVHILKEMFLDKDCMDDCSGGFVEIGEFRLTNKILPQKVREGVLGQCRNGHKIVTGPSGASYIVAMMGNDKRLGFGSDLPPPASFGFLSFRAPYEPF